MSNKSEDDLQWINDLVIQYIISPIWKQHTENFKDDFCLQFDAKEQKTQQQLQKIHQDFRSLLKLLVLDLAVQTQVPEKLLHSCISYNLKKQNKVFLDFELGSSFDAFAQMMKLRTLELDQESRVTIQKDPNLNLTPVANYTTAQMYREQFKDSVFFEQERLRKQALLKELEDDELRRAMQLSQEDYDAYLRRLKQMEDDELSRALRLSMEYMSSQKQSEFNSIISYSSRVMQREEAASHHELFEQPVFSQKVQGASNDDQRERIMAQRQAILQRKRELREQESNDYKKTNPSLFKSSIPEPEAMSLLNEAQSFQQSNSSPEKYQSSHSKVGQQYQPTYSNNSNPYQSQSYDNPYQSVAQNAPVQKTVQQGSVNLDGEALKKRNSVLTRLKQQSQQ